MNTKKNTMTLILTYMLNSNSKLHNSFNISTSTLDNMADMGLKRTACFHNVGGISLLAYLLYCCLEGLETCMACGIDLCREVHPNTKIIRIENWIGRRPEVPWLEVGHFGLLGSLCCCGRLSRCTMLLEDAIALRKPLSQLRKNFSI